MKSLTVTPALRAAIAAVQLAEDTHVRGEDSFAVVELARIALGRTVVAAWTRQQRCAADRHARRAARPIAATRGMAAGASA